MRKFILQITTFSFVSLTAMLFIFSLADGSTDAMYLKFTTPKQQSLVIGSSRAAQGIQPKYLNEVLERDDIYNYAFQIPSSPYGEIYSKSIKEKIDPDAEYGIFILEVNPWTLGVTLDSITNREYLIEKNGFIENTSFVDKNPNIEYLWESLNKKYSDIIWNKYQKGANQTYIVEDDGWLHVTFKSNKINKAKNIELKVAHYKSKLDYYKGISDYRLSELNSLISYLKKHGVVYLVRIPTIESMWDIENEMQSDFDEIIKKLAVVHNIKYINMMPNHKEYQYNDGNHLDVSSGKNFSINLANTINELEALK